MSEIPVEARYHVPRSQVWQGSRGRQAGATHLHVLEPVVLGRIRRQAGRALCGKDGWYERPPEFASELADSGRCARCVEIAARHGIAWPTV
jgi:hypothetical protein